MQRFSVGLAQEKLGPIPSKTILLDKSLQLSSLNPNQKSFIFPIFVMSLFLDSINKTSSKLADYCLHCSMFINETL